MLTWMDLWGISTSYQISTQITKRWPVWLKLCGGCLDPKILVYFKSILFRAQNHKHCLLPRGFTSCTVVTRSVLRPSNRVRKDHLREKEETWRRASDEGLSPSCGTDVQTSYAALSHWTFRPWWMTSRIRQTGANETKVPSINDETSWENCRTNVE